MFIPVNLCFHPPAHLLQAKAELREEAAERITRFIRFAANVNKLGGGAAARLSSRAFSGKTKEREKAKKAKKGKIRRRDSIRKGAKVVLRRKTNIFRIWLFALFLFLSCFFIFSCPDVCFASHSFLLSRCHIGVVPAIDERNRDYNRRLPAEEVHWHQEVLAASILRAWWALPEVLHRVGQAGCQGGD